MLNNEVKAIVNSLYSEATFILASQFNASKVSGTMERYNFPLVVLDNQLTKDVEIKKNFNFNLSTRLLLTIVDRTDHFATDEEKQTVIDDCETIALRIMSNVLQLESVESTTNQKARLTPAFNVYVAHLSGVILDMQVIEKRIINICKI